MRQGALYYLIDIECFLKDRTGDVMQARGGSPLQWIQQCGLAEACSCLPHPLPCTGRRQTSCPPHTPAAHTHSPKQHAMMTDAAADDIKRSSVLLWTNDAYSLREHRLLHFRSKGQS